MLVTCRNLPDYLLNWFALMEVGAVEVPVNPRSVGPELTGFVDQVRPRLVVTDAGLTTLVAAAVADAGWTTELVDVAEPFRCEADGRGPADVDPEDVAVMLPTSGTTGRSKLVMQTHLAYVMAGEGFPYWMRLTADDRLMVTLPLFHVNARAYSTLGSVAAGAGLVLRPGFSASGFLDDARRFGATEFNAIGAMLEILMRRPERDDDADNPLRLGYTGPSPTRERQEAFERRFGLELVCGYGMSESTYGLIWAHGTRPFGSMGAARQHPELGSRQRRPRARRRRRGRRGAGAAEPDAHAGLLRDARRDRRGARRRLAADRGPGDRRRRRHLHLRRAPQGGDPEAGGEPVAERGGGRPRRAPRRRRGRR